MDYSDDEDSSFTTYSTYYSYNYRPRSPEKTPPRAEPVLGYDLKLIDAGGSRSGKLIDLVFIMDCTGSMQRYINATRDHVFGICDMIRGEEQLNGPEDLRVAVINYRDHPPQDNTYVVKTSPFTSDIGKVQEYLKTLVAAGGGDGPEAVTAAMAATLTELEWRHQAAKMVVLIADAPPHGIGERGDQIKNGDPDGHDPLVIARTMAQNGITLFMVACEETLSNYNRAVDFFTALCKMTSGVMLPLTTADLLAQTIVGSVLENMDMERLIGEIGAEVAMRIKQKGETMQSVEEVAQELHERLMLRNEQTKQFSLGEVYSPSEEGDRNVQRWMNAQFITDARDQIEWVPGKRLTDRFRNNRESTYQYVPGGKLPPRKVSAPVSAPVTPVLPGSPPIGSPGSVGHASPSRRIVSDFKPFGSAASADSSVFKAPILPTGPGGGMFGAMGKAPVLNGGIREKKVDDDDDDEDDTPFTKSTISLDQARRIATQSVFRAGRLG